MQDKSVLETHLALSDFVHNNAALSQKGLPTPDLGEK